MLKKILAVIVLAAIPVGVWAAQSIGTVRLEADQDAVPNRINLQGYIADSNGNPIEGERSMCFKIYRSLGVQWEETRICTVETGLFSVSMGAVNPIPDSVFLPGEPRELELVIEGQVLSPRVGITSTGFAFRAVRSDQAASVDRPISPGIGDIEIVNGAVTMQKINQSGATVDQVVKWNGLSWAPGPDNAGGGVTSVSQGQGITCIPNPITTTGMVSLNTLYTDDRYIRNQSSTSQDANFKISGAGAAQQFAGTSETPQVPGIFGVGGTYCSGTYGESEAADWSGITGVSLHSTGTGIIGVGNNTQGSYLTDGSGGAFTGTAIGAFGYCSNNSGNRGGGYFAEPGGGFAWVAANVNGVDYKIAGQGQVATTMTTRAGDKSLFAPEMPEPWLEDAGRARLTDGFCRVDLEHLFSDCITVDADHPLNVFIQLNDDCNGVYAKTDENGFDVYELGNGRSNAEFTYRVLARWKGYEDLRFPDAPPRLETQAGSKPRLK